MRRHLTRCWLIGIGLLLLCQASAPHGQTRVAQRLDAAVKAAGVPIVGVSIGDETNKTTWKVNPPTLQAAAQPTIDAFNPVDPAHTRSDLDREARQIPRHVRALALFYLRDKLQRAPTTAERQAALDALIQAYTDVGP